MDGKTAIIFYSLTNRANTFPQQGFCGQKNHLSLTGELGKKWSLFADDAARLFHPKRVSYQGRLFLSPHCMPPSVALVLSKRKWFLEDLLFLRAANASTFDHQFTEEKAIKISCHEKAPERRIQIYCFLTWRRQLVALMLMTTFHVNWECDEGPKCEEMTTRFGWFLTILVTPSSSFPPIFCSFLSAIVWDNRAAFVIIF